MSEAQEWLMTEFENAPKRYNPSARPLLQILVDDDRENVKDLDHLTCGTCWPELYGDSTDMKAHTAYLAKFYFMSGPEEVGANSERNHP